MVLERAGIRGWDWDFSGSSGEEENPDTRLDGERGRWRGSKYLASCWRGASKHRER